MLEARQCYEALRAKDSRFDGVFFVGVSSTGIYCRPVCPVRTPAPERCSFYASAAAAEAAGFRPCLRCRPELAPGSASVDAARRLAGAAAARIEAGALAEGTLEELAAELGVGARQLRRALERELGVSPGALERTRRLLLAKQLLTDSGLGVAEIAFASGFSSVRQFNRTFRQRYRMTPSSLRRRRGAVASSGAITVRIGVRPPFAWGPLIDFLVARAAPPIERRDGDRYLRTARIDGRAGWLAAAPEAGGRTLTIEVSTELAPVLPQLLSRLRHLFDTRANPAVIEEHLGRDPRLAPLLTRRPGLRVPGAFDGFEVALRAVVGQQVSVKAATTIYGRLAGRFGVEVATPIDGLDRAAPSAEAVAAASPAELAALGLPGRRAETIAHLARAVAGGALRLEPLADAAAARAALLDIPGIGPWTAEYIAMRALGDPDAMPEGDLGLRRASGLESAAALRRAGEAWRPFRAYACAHLWASLTKEP